MSLIAGSMTGHPTFHPTNSPIQGVTGHHQPDSLADELLVDGTTWHQMDAGTPTHNPLVVGSIPTRPTTE